MLLSSQETGPYQSLTSMAIDQEAKAINTKAVAQETAMKQQAFARQQEYLQRMAKGYQDQLPPNAIQQQINQDANLDMQDKLFVSEQQGELTRLKQQLADAAQTGQIDEVNRLRDDIDRTTKNMFEYTSKLEKQKADKLGQSASVLQGVQDQTSYKTALESIRDNVDPALAKKLFQQFGPQYNDKVKQQIAAFTNQFVDVDKTLDNKRADQQLAISKAQQVETERRDRFNELDKNRNFNLRKEGLDIRKKEKAKTASLEDKQRQRLVSSLQQVENRFNTEDRMIAKDISEATTAITSAEDKNMPSWIREKIGPSATQRKASIQLKSAQDRRASFEKRKEEAIQKVKDQYLALGVTLEGTKAKPEDNSIDILFSNVEEIP